MNQGRGREGPFPVRSTLVTNPVPQEIYHVWFESCRSHRTVWAPMSPEATTVMGSSAIVKTTMALLRGSDTRRAAATESPYWDRKGRFWRAPQRGGKWRCRRSSKTNVRLGALGL